MRKITGLSRALRPQLVRPRVVANFAISFDGRITSRDREPSLFSSQLDKRRLVEIRALGDALLVGAGTVRADNMSMGLSDPALRAERVARGQSEYPLRVIVSNSGSITPDLKVFARAHASTHLFTSDQLTDERRLALERVATVHVHPGSVDLNRMLDHLRGDLGIRVLICEGGAQLFRSLCELDLVDELFLTWCPVFFGGSKAPGITGSPGAFLPATLSWRLVGCTPNSEGECFLHYIRRGRRPGARSRLPER